MEKDKKKDESQTDRFGAFLDDTYRALVKSWIDNPVKCPSCETLMAVDALGGRYCLNKIAQVNSILQPHTAIFESFRTCKAGEKSK